jgi:5-formaminoimidazole-4-carboxamide-1-beta-D-ribofuranosyl 5'-monophosphate synthetase
VSEALDKARKTLSEGFAECDTRQREIDELYIDNNFSADYFLSDTRQRLYIVSLGTRQIKAAVTVYTNGDSAFAECTR